MADKKGEEMIRIHVMGKTYRVPAGLTIMDAMEYAGYRFVRGAGCRSGFCGACSTVYRREGDYRLQFALACQETVEDGMYLVQLPFTPAPRTRYDIESAVRPTSSTTTWRRWRGGSTGVTSPPYPTIWRSV